MKDYAYGQQPADLGERDLALGWLVGIRHLKSLSATGSFWHVHRQIQLLYCIRGEFTYEFRNRPPVVLTTGNFIVIPPQLEHRHLQAIDPAGHRVEMLISARPSARGAFGSFTAPVLRGLLARLAQRACTAVPCSRELMSLFQELDGLAARGKADVSAADLALARTLSCLILQRCAEPPRTTRSPAENGRDTRLMDEAVAWLEAHSAEPIRLSRLISYMGYSRSRLFELFRRHTGLTPADWLVRHRIKRARKMLTASRSPIADIAAACGFSSASYFNTVFRRQTGVTPSAWRRSNL